MSPLGINETNYNFFCNICLFNDNDAHRQLILLPSEQVSIINCIEFDDKFNKIASLVPASATDSYGMVMFMNALNSKCLLLASYENGDLALFDLKMFSEISRLSIFKGSPLMSFDYSLDKNIGFAGSAEADLQAFGIIGGRSLSLINEPIPLKNAGINCIKIRASDSKIFACAGWDSRIRVYGLNKTKLLCVLDFHKENVNTLDFSQVNNTLVCGSNDGLISFWNLYNE